MANTEVTLVHTDGTYVPSVASVPVVSGDTVSFTTDDGSAALAYFSPAALAALSPKPSNPATVGAAGRSVFSFATSNPDAYAVVFAAQGSPAPANYPAGARGDLVLEFEASDAPPFTGPNDSPTTGHSG